GSPGDQVSDDRDRAWGNGGSGDLVSGPPWRAGKQRRYSRAGRRGGDGVPGRDDGRPRRNRGFGGAQPVAATERSVARGLSWFVDAKLCRARSVAASACAVAAAAVHRMRPIRSRISLLL